MILLPVVRPAAHLVVPVPRGLPRQPGVPGVPGPGPAAPQADAQAGDGDKRHTIATQLSQLLSQLDFKTCKPLLRPTRECRPISYDAPSRVGSRGGRCFRLLTTRKDREDVYDIQDSPKVG